MSKSGFDPGELELIKRLQEKVESTGENFAMHLEGLVHNDFLNYWDYVGIDALLNLQKPRTKYPDEMVFIVYHQMTELYFKVIMHEIEQIGFNDSLTVDFFTKKLNRINTYMGHMITSFDIFMGNMDHDQFMRFRTALAPASGFQSIQYRLIEVWSTKFRNLLTKESRGNFTDDSLIEDMYHYLYWKKGATDKETDKKSLTLIKFEEKYSKLIVRKGKELRQCNLYYKYKALSDNERNNRELIDGLRTYDLNFNVFWNLAHYKYAAKYLKGRGVDKLSTGGTNWQQYLPPKFQRQIFYPALWDQEEIDNWGKPWVMKEILKDQVAYM